MKMKQKPADISACAMALSSLTVLLAHTAEFTDADTHWANGLDTINS